jgi:hypothetical protein
MCGSALNCGAARARRKAPILEFSHGGASLDEFPLAHGMSWMS